LETRTEEALNVLSNDLRQADRLTTLARQDVIAADETTPRGGVL
jgi:hypothetical protein